MTGVQTCALPICEELGKPGFFEKIADETVCTELEPLIEYLAAVEHPALEMAEMV